MKTEDVQSRKIKNKIAGGKEGGRELKEDKKGQGEIKIPSTVYT